jgi:hypothetical protein
MVSLATRRCAAGEEHRPLGRDHATMAFTRRLAGARGRRGMIHATGWWVEG